MRSGSTKAWISSSCRNRCELDWARGRFARGGSTITQQLAKNLYLSPSKNPMRKLRELIIARRLEAELKKARILELYLNVIEWGDGVYGVEAAARTYFTTVRPTLGPAESALLAAAIINPRVLNPARPTARLMRRQQLILRRMGAVRHLHGKQPQSCDNIAAVQAPAIFDRNGLLSLTGGSWSRLQFLIPQRFSQDTLRSRPFPSDTAPTCRRAVSSVVRTCMINYTERLARLMQDIVVRVPTLNFIDIGRRVGVRQARTIEGRRPVCDMSLPDAAAERAWLLLLARSDDRSNHAAVRVVRHQIACRSRSADAT